MTTTTTLSLVALFALGWSACNNDPAEPAFERELDSARAATDDFATVEAALAAGYADIDVVYQNMGHHYLRAELMDATFQVEQPEILVYAADEGGALQLVAVEYAVPFTLAATAPEGFTGDADVWSRNETFELWTLHAWVHLENPDGVFAAHNMRVVVPSEEVTH